MHHDIVISDDKTVDETTRAEVLEDIGATVRTLDEKTVEAVAESAADADGLIVDAATPVTRAVFERADDLAVVGRAGIGVDNVDVGAARDHGITVVHVPDYCVDEVSTHALALLLASVRRLPVYDRQTKRGGWDWQEGRPIHRLRERTLGLVGFGKIPRRLARKVDGFGTDVIAADPEVSATEMTHFGVEKVGFEELLSRSDAVSVHAPLYEETRGLIDATAFEAMKPEAILVNTARGPIVDEDALYAALDEGEIARAALDVMTVEPPPSESPLLGRDDVLVTPHVGWYSEESRRELSRRVAEDVARVLTGAEPESPVDTDLDWT